MTSKVSSKVSSVLRNILAPTAYCEGACVLSERAVCSCLKIGFSQHFEDGPQQEHDVFARAPPTEPIPQEPSPEESAVNGVHPPGQRLRLQQLELPPLTYEHLAAQANILTQGSDGVPAPAPEQDENIILWQLGHSVQYMDVYHHVCDTDRDNQLNTFVAG